MMTMNCVCLYFHVFSHSGTWNKVAPLSETYLCSWQREKEREATCIQLAKTKPMSTPNIKGALKYNHLSDEIESDYLVLTI